MAIQAFLASYNFVWLFLVLVVIIYAALKTIKLPGNDWVLALASLLLSFIIISSTRVTNFLVDVIPYLTIIMVLGFFTLIIFVLVAKDLEPFKKGIAWVGFILAVLIILCMAFNSFPTLDHMLPKSSNHGLTANAIAFKDFIYSNNFKESAIFVVSIVIVGFFLLKKSGK